MKYLIAISVLCVGPLFAGVVPNEGAYARALELYHRTDYTGATAQLEHANDARSLQLLGQAWFMHADFKKATETFEKAAQLDPANADIQLWLGRAYGRRAETSFALSAFGLAGKSRDAFEKAVHLDPTNKEAVGDLFDFYLSAPSVVGGGMDKARALVPAIAKADPVEVASAQARIEEQQKNYPGAEREFRRAVEVAPQKIGHVLNLARFLARRGRFDESEKFFVDADRLIPDSPRVAYERAECYINTRHNLPQARDLLKKYLDATNLTADDPPRSDALKLLKKIEGS